MNYHVLLRMVPDPVEDLEVGPDGKSLDEQSVRLRPSDTDEHALEEALLLKERFGGTVTAVALEAPEVDEALFTALRDQTPESPDPEDAFSSVFIVNPVYGTRCSTVIMVNAEGQGRITERSFDADGVVSGEVSLDFTWPA